MFDFFGDVSRKTKANDLEKRWFDITTVHYWEWWRNIENVGILVEKSVHYSIQKSLS